MGVLVVRKKNLRKSVYGFSSSSLFFMEKVAYGRFFSLKNGLLKKNFQLLKKFFSKALKLTKKFAKIE